MEKINVLIYESYFHKLLGEARTVFYVLQFIDKEKFHPILITPLESEFVESMRKMGIECLVVSPPERLTRHGGKILKGNFISRFFTVFETLWYNLRLYRVIREKKAHVVYCCSLRALLLIAIASKLSRIPLVWIINGELQNRILDTAAFFLSNKILFQCEVNKNDKYPLLIRLFNSRVGVLKESIDFSTFIEIENRDKTPVKKHLSLDGEKVNIIVLGQLYPLKGAHYLIDALGIVAREMSNFKLYIVGDHIIDEYKSYKDYLLDLIQKNRLEDKVCFTGWVPDAMEVLSVMDVLVHSSSSEGMPLVIFEAMALSKSVVATKVGCTRELIKDGVNGFLVDPKNPEHLAQKLLILLRDRDLRKKLGQSARETVFSEYQVQDKIRELEKLFMDLAGVKRPDFFRKSTL